MRCQKLVSFLFLFSLLSTLLFSQTLAEIAKKERERRASLKGKKVVVITNADLAKLKKKPALEIPPAAAVREGEEQKAAQVPPPLEPQPQPGPAEVPSPGSNEANLKILQERYEKAKEYVELLTLKMGALWQQFSGLADMTSKQAIQQAIGETFIKLQDAQDEETKARLELEKFINETKKESVPPLWIR